MRDFAFYNAGSDEPVGLSRVVVPVRRLFRRILRPIFFRQEQLYRDLQDQLDSLARRQDEQTEQIQELGRRLAATDAFGWDYVAMARRLAAIEDRLHARQVTEASESNAPHASHGIPSPHHVSFASRVDASR